MLSHFNTELSMTTESIYFTTPIFYINGNPHVGHLYTGVAADVLRLFNKMTGKESYACYGTDEHGPKVEQAFKTSKCSNINEYTDQMSIKFRDLMSLANITPTEWIRTTSEDHKKVVTWLWQRIEANGHFYSKKYSGWYSKSDEAYYKAEEVNNERAISTGSKVEWMEEECVFFRLSSFKNRLIEYYYQHPTAIQPESKYNETMGLLRQDLPDLAISRTMCNWGIKAPNNPGHTIYVWLDALTNYLTFINRLNKKNTEDFKELGSMVHIIGKDILKFHAIYWPAFLMAADLPLFSQIFAHGWLLIDKSKMSKSENNVVDPNGLLHKYGVDPVRYYLMKGVSFGSDSNFSIEELERIVDADLADKVGNLVQRVLVFCWNKYKKTLSARAEDYSEQILKDWDTALEKAVNAMKNHKITVYIEEIIKAVVQTNEYIENQKPWKLEDPSCTMSILCLCTQRMAIALSPVMPSTSDQIIKIMGIDNANLEHWNECKEIEIAKKPSPLFKKNAELNSNL